MKVRRIHVWPIWKNFSLSPQNYPLKYGINPLPLMHSKGTINECQVHFSKNWICRYLFQDCNLKIYFGNMVCSWILSYDFMYRLHKTSKMSNVLIEKTKLWLPLKQNYKHIVMQNSTFEVDTCIGLYSHVSQGCTHDRLSTVRVTTEA